MVCSVRRLNGLYHMRELNFFWFINRVLETRFLCVRHVE